MFLSGLVGNLEEKFSRFLTPIAFVSPSHQIQYARSGVVDAKDMAEEKYELVHRKVVDTWGRINEEPEEGEITPEVRDGFGMK